VHTYWLSPNEAYEHAVLRFIDAILDRGRSKRFLNAFEPFQARVAELGIYNSLAQVLIKITAPGVPDFYQGAEFWDLNLVDPDNRRPVDYAQRRRGLADLGSADLPAVLRSRADGRVKMLVTTRALAARAQMRDVYEDGEYVPIETSGARRNSLFAFARRHRDRVAITCVPRLVASLVPDGAAPPIGPGVWDDTRIQLADFAGSNALPRFQDAFTGASIEPERTGDSLTIAAAKLFERFPVALLLSESRSQRSSS
jgi:(1->4)-alpha-D-glucan 1-alpha-D-glucosylmutase